MADAPAWYTASTARSELNIAVSERGLAAAQEQCLRFKGLALTTDAPPTESFAQGVVLQALANKQAAQAGPTDEMGGETQAVRLYSFDRRIRELLILPGEDADDTHDHGRVRSLIG